MLLVLDVGNSNTVLGLYSASAGSNNAGARYDQLIAHWRVTTLKTQTVDEYGVLFRNLFAADAIEVNSVKHIIISSVVPPVDSILREVCKRYFGVTPLFVEPGVKTGMPVQYDNPAEVGADRIVNGVAGFEKFVYCDATVERKASTFGDRNRRLHANTHHHEIGIDRATATQRHGSPGNRIPGWQRCRRDQTQQRVKCNLLRRPSLRTKSQKISCR